MTSADDVTNWVEAIEYFESGQFENAIIQFQTLTPTARIMFNIGCCFLCSEDLNRALQVRLFSNLMVIMSNHDQIQVHRRSNKQRSAETSARFQCRKVNIF